MNYQSIGYTSYLIFMVRGLTSKHQVGSVSKMDWVPVLLLCYSRWLAVYNHKIATTRCFRMHMPSSGSTTGHTVFNKLNSQPSTITQQYILDTDPTWCLDARSHTGWWKKTYISNILIIHAYFVLCTIGFTGHNILTGFYKNCTK
jgi:hypothetical protein